MYYFIGNIPVFPNYSDLKKKTREVFVLEKDATSKLNQIIVYEELIFWRNNELNFINMRN